jgi:hypothetical protein
MRFAGAALLVFFGAWILIASNVAGNGIHQPGSARLGIPIAALGLAMLIWSRRLVRGHFGEAVVRTMANVILLIGSISLIGSFVALGYRKFAHMDPSEISTQEGLESFTFPILFGLMCLGALILTNRREFTPDSAPRNVSAKSSRA